MGSLLEKSLIFVLLGLLGDSGPIRRGAVPVAEGEKVLAIDRFNRKNNASGGDGSLLRVARRRWLHHMRRGVAYGAICVGQPIGMKVHLLESGAEE
jgi:hypothetical protein